MKKVIGKLFALVMVLSFVLVMFSARTVEAASSACANQPAPAVAPVDSQSKVKVIYSKQCCDGAGVVRCILVNWTPLGDPCFCYGQGWGYVC